MPSTPPFLKVRVRKPQFMTIPRDLPELLSCIYCFCRLSGGLAEESCAQCSTRANTGHRGPPKGPTRTSGPSREKGVNFWGHMAPTSPSRSQLSRPWWCSLGPASHDHPPAAFGGDPRPEPHRATSSLWAHLELSPDLGPAETAKLPYNRLSPLSQ